MGEPANPVVIVGRAARVRLIGCQGARPVQGCPVRTRVKQLPPPERRSSLDTERLLARRFLEAQGWSDGFFDEIHPLDDMYLTLGNYGLPPHTQRMSYFRDGEHALCAVENALEHAGRSWSGVSTFLEFACGHGRFTRFLVHRLPPERIHSADVLRDGVDYCREHLGVHGFYSEFDPEAVAFETRYDVIYVGSLFSHLPRERFGQWLRRLHGQLTPEGILLFSVHGPKVVPEMTKSADGFTYIEMSETQKLTTEEYGSTFIDPRVLGQIATESAVPYLYRIDRDVWNSQDIYAATHVPIQGLSNWRSTRRVWGRLIQLEERENRTAWLGGFVRWPEWDAPVTEVRLAFDGEDIAEMVMTEPGIAEPAESHRSAFMHREYYVEGPIPDPTPGMHTIEIHAISGDGRKTCIDVRALELA